MMLVDTKYLIIEWDWGIVQCRKFKFSRQNAVSSWYLQVGPLQIVWWTR